MNALKIVFVFLLAIVLSFVNSNSAKAGQICYPEYGGGETCVDVDDTDLDVNKTIWNPLSDSYEDHISPNSGSYPYLFDPSEKISFRIEVKNTGDVRIEDISLVDILPQFVKYYDGDGDGKNDDTKVEFDEFDLDAGESETFEFRAKVASDGILPKDDKICLTNVAEAEGNVEDSDDEESGVDYANFCIDLPGKEKPGSLPVTGGLKSDGSWLVLVSLVAGGFLLIGFGMRRLSKAI